MALVLTAAPTAEPVTLAEAKAHLRVEEAGEDPFIAALIETSRLHIEAALGLALLTQTWSWRLDGWPDGDAVVLPLKPVQAIPAVRITAADGTVETMPASSYILDGASAPPRLHPKAGRWPQPGARAQGIEIELVAGYGDEVTSVPAPIRQALLMLVAHWYEHREPVLAGTVPAPIPDTVSALLAPYRTVRL
jgi:uncharacterized phiE125 gp8 family phage protein